MVARFKLATAPEAKVYLAEWRMTKFATQRELADAMGMNEASVSRIETGERDWSKGYLEALAYLVGCQVGDLFHPPGIGQSNPALAELMQRAVTLSDKELDGLLALLGNRTASGPPSEPAVAAPAAMPARAK